MKGQINFIFMVDEKIPKGLNKPWIRATFRISSHDQALALLTDFTAITRDSWSNFQSANNCYKNKTKDDIVL